MLLILCKFKDFLTSLSGQSCLFFFHLNFIRKRFTRHIPSLDQTPCGLFICNASFRIDFFSFIYYFQKGLSLISQQLRGNRFELQAFKSQGHLPRIFQKHQRKQKSSNLPVTQEPALCEPQAGGPQRSRLKFME